MNPAKLRLDIVSAEEAIFSGDVAKVFVVGEAGELGIMPGHTPLLTTLKAGNVRSEMMNGEEDVFYIKGGMLEIQPYVVTILADTAIRGREIDEAAALEAKAQAEARLSKAASEVDFAQASAELAEAIAQIQAVQKLRKRMK